MPKKGTRTIEVDGVRYRYRGDAWRMEGDDCGEARPILQGVEQSEALSDQPLCEAPNHPATPGMEDAHASQKDDGRRPPVRQFQGLPLQDVRQQAGEGTRGQRQGEVAEDTKLPQSLAAGLLELHSVLTNQLCVSQRERSRDRHHSPAALEHEGEDGTGPTRSTHCQRAASDEPLCDSSRGAATHVPRARSAMVSCPRCSSFPTDNAVS